MASNHGVGVYVDSDTCLYHFHHIEQHNSFRARYFQQQDLESFCSSTIVTKLSAFHVPFTHDPSWLSRLESCIVCVDHVFIFCSELHAHTVQLLESLDRPKISIFICGFISYQFRHAKIHRWMDWFVTTTYFYKTVKPELLQTKLVDKPKKQYFDILLGCARPHRDFVYNRILQDQLQAQVVMTYYRRWNVDLRTTEHIFENEDLEFLPENNYTHSVHQVLYHGHRMNLSQVLPFVIYNNSHYSLVAETNANNAWNFYTEKIVKPILAKRLFVVVAGQNYLKNLKLLGFKTFDHVIDESYDSEPDDHKRWNQALNQVQWLVTQDVSQILEQIQPVVDHNHALMLQHDWYHDVTDQLLQDVADIIVR